jgi:hypothetical protein
LSLFTGLALVVSVLADTVTLKSGEKIEGKILSETDAQVVVEVVAGGVVEERTIPKADVASIGKIAPDELAWQPLKGLKLGENSLPASEQYDAYTGPLKGFIAQFPNSAHKAEAGKLVAEFEAEQKRVTDGEVKLKGRWLSKEEALRERYQVSGAIAANYMETQITRNDTVGAMNTFEIIEKDYSGSRGYLTAVELARRVLPVLKQAAAQRLAALPTENAEREHGVKAAAGLDKIQLQKELEAEKKNNQAALAEAKQQGLKWPPFLRRSDVAMKEIVKLADDTERRLAAVDVAKSNRSLDLAELARADFDNKDLTAAEAKLKEARQLWAKNEIVTRLDKELIAAKATTKAAEPEPTPEPPKPEPKATPKPKATPISVAKAPASSAVKEEEEEKPTNWLFLIVGGVIFAALAFVVWTAYRKVVKKANEIIE